MTKLENKFISATDFSKGKAIVKAFNSNENYCINKSGEVLFKTEFEPISSFNQVNQLIVYNSESCQGVIDNCGKVVIPCEYDYIYQKIDGYQLEKRNITKLVDFNGTTTFKAKSGQNVLPFYQKRITSLSNCIPEEQDGKYGIINVETKEVIIPFKYDSCWFFMEFGLAQVCKNGKYGFVNSENKIVIPIEYDRVGIFGFQSGLCLVEKNNNCGLIDKNNNLIIPLKYGSSSGEFIEGIACVEVLNKKGNYYKYITIDDKDAF